MRIIASKIDDLRRQKKARADHKKWYDSQTNKMWKDQYNAAYKPIKEYLEENLSKFDLLDINVYINGYWSEVEIRIKNESQLHQEDAALCWNYDVDLQTEENRFRDAPAGVVRRQTSSWSGLSAVTENQIAHLEQCVEAIKWLNSVNWQDILDRALSEASTFKYDDYHNENNYEGDMDFDAEIVAEQLRELVGRTDVLVKSSSDYNPSYYMIHKETPKFFIVSKIPRYVVEEENVKDSYQYKYAVEQLDTERLKKESVAHRFSDPIETVEI